MRAGGAAAPDRRRLRSWLTDTPRRTSWARRAFALLGLTLAPFLVNALKMPKKWCLGGREGLWDFGNRPGQ